MRHRSEGDEQLDLFRWAYKQQLTVPELALLHHIPNGGDRNRGTGARLKLEGVKRGVPDICLPVARNGYHGLYIELKVGENVPSEYQAAFLGRLNDQGYCALVCYGAADAYRALVDYLELAGHPDLLTLEERKRVNERAF